MAGLKSIKRLQESLGKVVLSEQELALLETVFKRMEYTVEQAHRSEARYSAESNYAQAEHHHSHAISVEQFVSQVVADVIETKQKKEQKHEQGN